jgi:hypothetical protein
LSVAKVAGDHAARTADAHGPVNIDVRMGEDQGLLLAAVEREAEQGVAPW